jgi:serine/threonine protein kinase
MSVSFLNHELKIKSYTVLVTQRLAQGGFGYVDLAKDIRNNRDVVLKRCSIARQESFAVVNKEIRILQQFKGPYIVELIAEDIININGKQEAVLLLELCPGGHLLQRLIDRSNSKSYYNQNEIYKIFGQICSAVKSLHENTPPITHRDLKLENILFGIDGNVRLCDFGSCAIGYTPLTNASERSTAEEIIAKETTQMYRSPELIDLYMREILTEKTDIWALGCILYAISFLKHPFQDIGGLGILSCNVHYPNDPPVAEESKILMKRMLDFDPEARPSVGQIIDAIAALLRNEPLPHYELSPDAVKKRQ